MRITRLFDFIRYQAEEYPKSDALCSKENGSWRNYSTSEVLQMSDRFSSGLVAMGFQPGDKIAMITNNRPEWNFADIGMMQIGVINVPIYTTLSEQEIRFILHDCGAKMVIAGNEELYRKVVNVREQVPSLNWIFTFDHIPGQPHWFEVLEAGDGRNPDAWKALSSNVSPADCATILYTSGTTGVPKGVMLSHYNMVSNVLAVRHLPPVDKSHRALSFLPLCHSYERVLTYLYQYLGVSVYYAESMEKIVDNLKEVKPHVFSSVPRLLEKVYDRIVDKGKELTGVKRGLFFWSLGLAHKFELDSGSRPLYAFKLSIARKLVFSKWREALGGNVKVIVSGGAALQPRLARVFWAAGIPVLEGYGLTETSPIIAVNNFEENGTSFGTVGPVISGVSVRIADDGEIVCKGPNVMMGYYNRPDLTAEVIDSEGWFHTGDIGTFIDHRFLKITDRKKEIFKTSGGKYIAPQAIENKLKESPFIEQIMVVGENERFPGALIVPAFPHLQKWAEHKGIPFKDNRDLISKPEVIDKISREVQMLNEVFGQTEQIKKFELLPAEWTIDSGELTATLKLRRKIIAS
ncbi:MAG: AMP-dependent synthetase/ligase, partial [Bacteroidota bacterium]